MIDKVCFWAAILLFIIGTVAIFLMGHFNRAPDFPFPGQNKKYVPSSTEAFWSSASLPSVSRPHAAYRTEQISLQPEHQESDDSADFIYIESCTTICIFWCMYYILNCISTIINDSQDRSAVLLRLAECPSNHPSIVLQKFGGVSIL